MKLLVRVEFCELPLSCKEVLWGRIPNSRPEAEHDGNGVLGIIYGVGT